MSKRPKGDRRPPSQKNPRETFTSTEGKGGVWPTAEVKSEEDLTFPVTPADFSATSTGVKKGSRPITKTTEMKAALEAFVRNAQESDRMTPFFTVDFSAFSDAKPLSEADKIVAAQKELQARERQARASVKDYLIPSTDEVDWEQVVGNDEARQALIEAVEAPVKQAEMYAAYGLRPPAGALLYGPPGCGKTMLAKAAATALRRMHAGDDDRPLGLFVNGPSIQSPYVGVTEREIRDIFTYAKAYRECYGTPLFFFLDEAEVLLPSRNGAHSYQQSNVATFLTEMQGLQNSSAFVLLASNRPESIDEALLRDGRCDRKIKVVRPNRVGVQQILQKDLERAPLAGGGDAAFLAAQAGEEMWADHQAVSLIRRQSVDDKGTPVVHTDYLRLRDIINGALAANLVNTAKMVAFRRDLANGCTTPRGLTLSDLRDAIAQVVRENRGLAHSYAMHEYAERHPGQMIVATHLPPGEVLRTEARGEHPTMSLTLN